MNEDTPDNGSIERYRFDAQMIRLPAGDGMELLNSELTGAVKLVPGHDVNLLMRCDRFATLDEHATRLCNEQGLGSIHFAAIRQKLKEAALDGLLLSRSSLVELCTDGTTNDTEPRIAFLGIPTRNRPDHLTRCLATYANCAAKSGRDVTIVVADQSDGNYRLANISVMQEIKSKYGARIWHLDNDAVSDIITQLAALSGLPQSIIDFALTNRSGAAFAGGANRNLLLLSSVGEMCLQVDDDSTCRAVEPPELSKQFVFTSENDPTDCWFSSHSEIASLLGDAIVDVFALHEQLLGKTLGRCIEEQGINPTIDGANSGFFRRLHGDDNRILVTNAGLAGESGKRAGQPFLFTEGSKRARLIASEDNYRSAQQNQQILRGVTSPTVTDGTICFGFNLGLDNRTLIPPFMPIMRGEDTVFSCLLRVVWKGGFLGLLPWLTYHSGAGRKKRAKEIEPTEAVQLQFAELLSLMIQMYQGRALQSQTADRLRAASDWLIEIGSGPTSEFERVLRRVWWQSATTLIRKLEHALKMQGNQPDFWAKDLRAHVEGYRQSLVDPSFLISADIIETFGIDGAMKKQQELVQRFGEFLRVWPELRLAALQLRQRHGSFAALFSRAQTVSRPSVLSALENQLG